MPKRKRKIDLRRIRTRACYSVPEAAQLLGVAEGTIRAWLRAGLAALDCNRPTLILGADLKAWLQERQSSRRRKCRPDELFCLRCRWPRKLVSDSAQFIEKNPKMIMIRGNCFFCGATMNKVASRAKMAEVRAAFMGVARRQEDLVVCTNSSQNHEFGLDGAE